SGVAPASPQVAYRALLERWHWPPTEKSWPHFRPSAVDFCGSRLAIGAATERARALAMPAELGLEVDKLEIRRAEDIVAAVEALKSEAQASPGTRVSNICQGTRLGSSLPPWLTTRGPQILIEGRLVAVHASHLRFRFITRARHHGRVEHGLARSKGAFAAHRNKLAAVAALGGVF